jgi:sugar phosphate isomerase/epimerase
MAFGLIHYNTPGDTIEEFLDFLVEAGFGLAEIQVADVWPEGEANPEARAEYVAHYLRERDLTVSALTAGNNFCVETEAEITAQAERMKRVLDLADILGTKILRTDGGWPGPDDTRPGSYWVEPIVKCLERCLEFAAPRGFKFAIDNHGNVTNEWPVQLMIFDKLPSPAVGANLDTMNYRWWGQSVELLREIYVGIAPHVIHTHLKDGIGSRENYQGRVLGEGEIPLEFAVQCLKDTGYEGPWMAEYEVFDGDKAADCQRCLQWMLTHI